ncbi:hypothetical protein D3C87_1946560 [compost metagenome]
MQAQRFDEQDLEHPLKDHFLARFLAAAFFHDELDHPAEPRRSPFRGWDMNHARQQGKQERSVGLLDAEGAAQ